MKNIVILGSTGSIGTNTLDIVDRFPQEFRVVGLTAGSNDEKLEAQIRKAWVSPTSDVLSSGKVPARACSPASSCKTLPAWRCTTRWNRCGATPPCPFGVGPTLCT